MTEQKGDFDLQRFLIESRQSERIESLKMAGLMLSLLVKWPIAYVLHPLAAFRATFQLGKDSAAITKDLETAFSLPKLPFPRGRQRLS